MKAMSAEQFRALLDKRDAAREAHESYCAEVNGGREWAKRWSVEEDQEAMRLYRAYLSLEADVQVELEAERLEGK